MKKALIALPLVIAAAAVYLILARPKPASIAAEIRVGEEVLMNGPGGPQAGSLLLPGSGALRSPAVVMVTGSGSYSYRSSWRPGRFPFWKGIAEAFLGKGYAVLLLEKRGVNGSGGYWSRQTFHDRADDVRAAVDYLKTRPEIDAARIGVCGHSQGGWVAQLAAAEFPDDVAFIVCLAGANVTVKRQIIDDRENEWRCAGLAEEKIGRKVRGLRRRLNLLGAVSRVVRVGYLARIIDYDPRDVVPRIQCPVLAIYGENDTLVPPVSNSERLEEGLTESGRARTRMIVIPGANHGFRLSAKCFKQEDIELRFAPGFLEAIAAWDPFPGE